MLTVSELLDRAGIKYEPYAPAKVLPVYLTLGNQLIGTYAVLESYRTLDGTPKGNHWHQGWQAHHVVEKQDLARLQVEHLAASSDDQLCVLLPERAHIGRINSRLRKEVPIGQLFHPRDFLKAYKEAYEVMGDYSGGGEVVIRRELVSIVKTTFRTFGLV